MANSYVISSFEDEGFHNVTWCFNLAKFKDGVGAFWHRHTRVMTRPYIVNGRNLIYASDLDRIKQLDKTGAIAQNACWSSPMLNRGLRHSEYSLTRVLLRYEAAADCEMEIHGTGDGGVTWPASFKTVIPLQRTRGRLMRAIQAMYTTGTDVRFCLNFPNDALVYVRTWKAEIMPRGSIGGLEDL